MSQDQDEVLRLLDLLRMCMIFLKIPIREMDRRLEAASGTTSRLLSGKTEVPLDQVLAMVRALGLSYADFMHLAYPGPVSPTSEAARRLLALQRGRP